MYARLNPTYWAWKNEEGIRGAFIVSEVYRYAGMLAGLTPAGMPISRPLIEYDALSVDGVTWEPQHKLRSQLPWENDDVPEQYLCLPEPEESRADEADLSGPLGGELFPGGGSPDLPGPLHQGNTEETGE